MKKSLNLFAVFILLSASSYAQLENFKIVDLSYSYDKSTIYWPTEDDFKLEVQFDGTTEKGYHYSSNKFTTAEHGGTHLDAPIHFYESGRPVDEIPLKDLFGKAVVIDISDSAANDADYQVSSTDFLVWEQKNGRIDEGSIILIKTGLGKYWPDRVKYMGTDERGAQAVAKLHFPGLHPKGAEWLVDNRKIKAVGIESPSIDFGQSTHFETHVILGSNNIPIFENVANLEEVPIKDFYILALPMKIKNGSGGPVRIAAFIKE